jgi:2-hydroxychromene-2-carboxylate isomerase
MPVNVEYIFDVGSPNGYLAHRGIPEVVERTGTPFKYVPCLLGGLHKATGAQPPTMFYAGIKGRLEYEALERDRFVAKHKLDKFSNNPHFPVNTLITMRGAIAAEMDGRLADYAEAAFCAMWEQGLKMDDPEIYVETMTKAGFDGADLLARTQDDAVKKKLLENTMNAVERGAFGVPTFFVGDEIFYGKERLGQIEEEILAQS